jgi:hypothetical protein
MRPFVGILVTLLVVTASPAAHAITLLTNLGQTIGTSSGLVDGRRVAIDFTTGVDASSITSATLYIRNLDSISHTFPLQIWTDNAGLPGTLVDSFDSTFTVGANNSSFLPYIATDAGISLSPNTTYWLMLQKGENDSGDMFSNSPDFQIVSTGQAVDTGSVFSTISGTGRMTSDNSGSWFQGSTNNYRFSLTGITTTPEPSRLMLAAAGLGACLLRRRRQA